MVEQMKSPELTDKKTPRNKDDSCKLTAVCSVEKNIIVCVVSALYVVILFRQPCGRFSTGKVRQGAAVAVIL